MALLTSRMNMQVGWQELDDNNPLSSMHDQLEHCQVADYLHVHVLLLLLLQVKDMLGVDFKISE
jgi:hypothetical protein